MVLWGKNIKNYGALGKKCKELWCFGKKIQRIMVLWEKKNIKNYGALGKKYKEL